MRQMARRAVKFLKRLFFILFLSSFAAVLLLKFVPVYVTPLMLIRGCEQLASGEKLHLHHHWIPLDKISPALAEAVVASEDNRFPTHHGFDFQQIAEAREEAEAGGRVRGASTISQQTAKNVFLWPGRSYLRKGLEAYFTVLIEFVWGKRRIMEVYLNSIEMGDGLFGAEACAEAHFHKPALRLTAPEAALVAASLPNPRRFNSARPSPYMLRRQAQILSLMDKIGKLHL